MPPGSAEPLWKSAQRVQVLRHSVVSVITLDHPLQPLLKVRYYWIMRENQAPQRR
jgi:hypothetical protein